MKLIVDLLYVGIDIGKFHHEACLLTPDGKVRQRLRIANTRSDFDRLWETVADQGVDTVVWGMEATGHYWLAIYAALTRRGATVKVINPLQSDSLRKLYIRVTKTDPKDSFIVADLLRIGRYTETVVPPETTLALRDLSRLRVEFVESLGTLKRQAHAVMDRIFPEWTRLWVSKPWGTTARAVLTAYPTPQQLAQSDTEELTALLVSHSRGRLGREFAETLKQTAEQSFGVTYGLDAATLSMRLLMDQMTFLESQIHDLDRHLESLMESHALILSIPGIGPTLGATILGEIGDIHRFTQSKKLKAYAGLDASVHKSGEFEGTQTRLSKRGSPYLRRAIWLAAFTARQRDPGFQAYYEAKRARGKHPNQALGAVAGKLCQVIWAVLTHDRPYDPTQILPAPGPATAD